MLETTYSVTIPSPLAEYIESVEVLGLDWLAFALPAGCLVRGFNSLLVTALAPILILLIKLLKDVGQALYQKWWKGSKSLSAALRHGVFAAVPFMLLDIFVSVPTVSARIFAAWSCEGYGLEPGVDRYFLRADPSVLCSSDGFESSEHARLTQFAVWFIALWAVGVPCLYLFLLAKARRAILSRTPTRWSRACSFLLHDFTAECYWYEMVNLCYRLVICGWVALIPERHAFLRTMIAVVARYPPRAA